MDDLPLLRRIVGQGRRSFRRGLLGLGGRSRGLSGFGLCGFGFGLCGCGVMLDCFRLFRLSFRLFRLCRRLLGLIVGWFGFNSLYAVLLGDVVGSGIRLRFDTVLLHVAVFVKNLFVCHGIIA